MSIQRNLWPIGVILTFAVFIPATAGLIVLAVSQKEDLVSPNYYEQELKYQGQLDSLERAHNLGARASVAYDGARGRIAISIPADQVRLRAAGHVHLYRPSEAGLDRTLDFAPDSNGVQIIEARDLRPGLWKVRVSWAVAGRAYLLDEGVTNLARAPLR